MVAAVGLVREVTGLGIRVGVVGEWVDNVLKGLGYLAGLRY